MASKILEEVRDVMRRRHYSIHTERTYCDWIKRYIQHFNMQSRTAEFMDMFQYRCDLQPARCAMSFPNLGRKSSKDWKTVRSAFYLRVIAS